MGLGKSINIAMDNDIVTKYGTCYHEDMLSEFIERKLKSARYKLLKDGSYFGEVPGLKGVWANATNLEDCREELREVLEDWLFLKVRAGERVSGFEVRVDQRQLVKHA